MLEIKFSGEAERRRFGIALLLSIVIMAIGLSWSMNIGLRANQTDHVLYHESEHLSMLRHLQGSPQAGLPVGVTHAGGGQ
jgi:hypothetical protein